MRSKTSGTELTMLLGFIIVCLTATFEAHELCKDRDDFMWRRYPDTCNTLYFCFSGKALTFRCPSGHVVGANRRFCVRENSELDDCSQFQVQKHGRLLKVPLTCKSGEKFPSEKSCAKYSKCITSENGTAMISEQECPYPLLYDVTTQKCSHYNSVKCETGVYVPRDPCEYDANKCGSGQSGSCIPCNIRFPSCNGRPDGMNSWQGKEWSPYYVVCKQERISYHTMCKSEKTSSVFHPDKRACVQFDKVEEIVG